MSYWLSRPIETLLQQHGLQHGSAPGRATESEVMESGVPGSDATALNIDTLVVGSGYGAAMATLALLESEKPPQLWVFERGGEYLPDDFPRTIAELPGHIGSDRLNPAALWDVRPGDNVVTISARGLGGTSLVNANVAARAAADVLDQWPVAEASTQPWAQRLGECYDKLETLFGVSRPSAADKQQPGFQAFQATAAQLGSDAEAAPLTINFAGPTAHSVDHAPCDRCGNCVIGCHSGAKGSLNMNAWPLARQLGAELFTGVTIRSLERRADGRWRVHCQCAARPEREFVVLAERVIVAAGTLGSTEILKRSEQKHELGLSERLGHGFSTNGDALVAGVGQRHVASGPVGVPGERSGNKPGPTIRGMASVALDASDPKVRFTLEDAVIPYPLTEIWQELLTSQSLLRRFADGSVSGWHEQHPQHDFLARSSELASHSQALLIMGLDESDGQLIWEDDRLKPAWTSNGEPDYFSRLDQRLRSHERDVFDGGLFMPNMLSQPLPPGFDGVLEGAGDLRGSLLSVHPLGGCNMAAGIEDGVVNTRGQVFTTQTDGGCYDNLYVLDGAIIPGAIGTNPFLTIAALAYVLARDIVPGNTGLQATFPVLKEPFRTLPSSPDSVRPLPDPEVQGVTAEFSERLVLHLDHGKRSFFPWSRAHEVPLPQLRAALGLSDIDDDIKALVLDATFSFSGANTLERWLQNPRQPLEARATLSADPVGGILTTADRPLRPLTRFTGKVMLGTTEPVGAITGALRVASAVARYIRYRGMDLLARVPGRLARLLIPEQAARIRYPELFDSSAPATRPRKGNLLHDIKAFLRIARLQSQRRYLVYEFQSDEGAVIEGRKTLAYGLGLPDVLRAWLVLPAAIRATPGAQRLNVEFELDTIRVTRGELPLQIVSSPHAPASLMAAGGFAMYALRILMQTHFWSFGAPSYKQFATRAQMETTSRQGRYFEPPDFIFYGTGGRNRSTRREKFERGEKVDGELRPMSRLIRYQPGKGDPARRKSLLLIHGLAHSSRVFWTDTIACNFVQYFLGLNYDVWVLDHRVSANYVRNLTKEHTWDDIANIDIPWAVQTAFERINQDAEAGQERGVHIFAHCIGAGAAAIAVLQGKLDRPGLDEQGEPRSMVASLIPHAVTPWLTTSGENRARANAWAMVKDLEPLQFIEPMPYRDPPLLETVYDRLSALAMNADERRQWSSWRGYRDWRGPGFAQSIYTRYTLFWGRQWHDANISQATRYEFAGMIGPVPIGVMQQVYFSLTRGLLSAHDGSNPYVKAANFDKHWPFPTLFLHGNRNTVFDMDSSRHSADQLTRLRMLAQSGSYPQGDLAPQDYARQKVWIEVLDDYGHMDMIFSKTADRDVFPRLHEFFCAAEEDRMLHRYDQRFATSASREWFHMQCASNSSSKLIRRPLTGPVVSRPVYYAASPVDSDADSHADFHVDSGPRPDVGTDTVSVSSSTQDEVGVRLWLEAQDFAALSASGLNLQPVTGRRNANCRASRLPMVARSSELSQTSFAHETLHHWQEEFWLYDVRIPASEASPLHLSLSYDSDQTSAGEAGQPASTGGVHLAWHGLPWYQRVLRNVAGPQPLTLLAGSCLYPGFPFERQISTAIFEGMWHQLSDEGERRGADAVLLLGDQIYADATAGLLDPLTEYERFRYPYRQAFGNPAARRLLSHVPVYMAVDDHEYRDNWRGPVETDDSKHNARQIARDEQEFQYSRTMAWLFQMHHDHAWDGDHVRLWYDFQCAGHPVFVFDTRFQRQLSASEKTRLLDAKQFAAFERWLEQQAADASPVIFLASGSPLGPVSRDLVMAPALAGHDDSLFAYPMFLSHLTRRFSELARTRGWAPRVVWLTGDPHLSCVAELTLRVGDDQLMLTQVCCSGLYAPLSFINANAADYDWETPFELRLEHHGEPLHISGQQHLLTDYQQHFVRIDLVPEQSFELRAQAFDATGQPVGAAVRSPDRRTDHGAANRQVERQGETV